MDASQQHNSSSSIQASSSLGEARPQLDVASRMLDTVFASKVLLYLLLKTSDPPLSYVKDLILQVYVVVEVIYIISTLEVKRPRFGTISWYINLVSGSVAFELLLWVTTSPILMILVNVCIIICLITSCNDCTQQSHGEPVLSRELNV